MRWTDEQVKQLRMLWGAGKTSKECSESMGIGRTNIRTKIYELGLQRFECEYWTDLQLTYLFMNYKTKGDVEIAEYLQKHMPKHKKWTHKHIRKKRVYLSLHRTKEEIAAIRLRNVKLGMYVRGAEQSRRTRLLNCPEGTIRWYLFKCWGKRMPYKKVGNKFIPLARAVWLEHHPGYVFTKRDRVIQKICNLDFSIDNIEKVDISEISKYRRLGLSTLQTKLRRRIHELTREEKNARK